MHSKKLVGRIVISMVIQHMHIYRSDSLGYRRLHVMPPWGARTRQPDQVTTRIIVKASIGHSQYDTAHIFCWIVLFGQGLKGGEVVSGIIADPGPDNSVKCDISDFKIRIFFGIIDKSDLIITDRNFKPPRTRTQPSRPFFRNFFVLRCTRTDPLQLSGILAETLKIPRFEASKQASLSLGIPAQGLTECDAQQLQIALRRHGIDSLLFAENAIQELPAAIQVRGAKLDDKSLHLYENPDRNAGKGWKVPWDLHLFLCCGRVKITVEERKRETRRRSLSRYGGVSGIVFQTGGGPVRETKIKKKTNWRTFFDLVSLDSQRHFRVVGEEFNYLAIGLDQPTVFKTLTVLIRNISLRCKNGNRDNSIDNILDGDPLTNAAFPCPEAYDNHVHRGVLLHLHDRESF